MYNRSIFVPHNKQAGSACQSIYEILHERLENICAPNLQDEIPTGDLKVDYFYLGYEDTPILKEVSFNVLRGEVTAFVGPSGSGNSTLFSLI
ncbi:ATP-binding cassette domain-containing protein, partial [Staphylococcus pseudintermedius]|uniref:ATP-binding cassette domain-containing protein n=1 Tax=Staphylococcus pseudintermedius TaxID=283734 RepID=UPI001E44443F